MNGDAPLLERVPRHRRARSRLRIRIPASDACDPPRPGRGLPRAVCAGARAYWSWSCRRGCRAYAPRTSAICARPAAGRRSPASSRRRLLVACATPVVLLLPYVAATRAAAVGGRVAAPRPSRASSFPTSCCGRRSSGGARRSSSTCPRRSRCSRSRFGAGQSLRQALELAARDCSGPLGEELTRALSLARRERSLGEREALVRVAREAGEPTFARFCELLAAKESPYLDFLRQQAREARAEQNRYLERAADRAYLAMHAPVAPLLAVLVLLLAYGFLRFLAQTV